MGILLNIILVAIFFYLLIKLFASRRFFNPYKRPEDLRSPRNDETPGNDDAVRKSIDMSNVEDADFKEVDE
ncbi:MAG: hypothetical protein PHX07_07065 [Candidatus Marinimicrobia bacterium]|jgi:hypothetical protein|nr:hypothetical protein [Candidatus Neomarinimicrobiota bacterium]MDD4961981.1 hypothetical protein [Candidatus Neomarinimicrobiota bacterium]MDD5709946.1 hypothetical protein [Candidatus Neomarinimicrobiota bacterium]MDX9778315.1 hypothetical protein [bacterium]